MLHLFIYPDRLVVVLLHVSRWRHIYRRSRGTFQGSWTMRRTLRLLHKRLLLTIIVTSSQLHRNTTKINGYSQKVDL